MTLRFFIRLSALKIATWVERYYLDILIVVAMISMTVSTLIGLHQSMWFDENYSIMLAQRPVHELIAFTAVDAHPPLYYLLLKVWMTLFGASEFALRLSSVLCSGAAIVLVGILLKELFSKRVALAALPFIAFAPFLMRYSYEIRMYEFVVLIGVASTLVMVRAWRTQQVKWWIVYGLFVVVGMYTLYMSAVFWLAHLAWLLIITGQARKKIIRQPYWITYISAAVLFLPWLPTVLSQLRSSALPPYMDTVSLYQLTNVLGLLMAYRPGWQIGAWLSVFVVGFIGVYIYVAMHVWRRVMRTQRQGLLLLGLCFVVGVIFYALISLPPNPPRFLERYVVHISVFWYALLGVIIAYGWKLRLGLSVLFLTIISVGMMSVGVVDAARLGNYNFQRMQDPQSKDIREALGCEDTTYVTAGPFGYIDMRYDLKDCDVKFYYPWDVTFKGGFAPINGSKDEIKYSQEISTKRIVSVYYDDSDVTFTPDARFHEVERRSFDKTRVIIYQQ